MTDVEWDKGELGQMERELFKATPHDVPNGPLFHYTDGAGLLGILASKEVWVPEDHQS